MTSPVSISPPSSIAEITEISGLKEKIKELSNENKKLTTELEKVKEDLDAEKQKKQAKEEKLLQIQSWEETIHAQKQSIDLLSKEITTLKNNSILYHNILLIGRTGSGKSTLANVLSNSHEFKESPYGAGETREIQIKEFAYRGVKYRVIDTPGIGDTKLNPEEVLDKIAEAAYYAREGINQILFVTRGRFDKDEVDAYKLTKAIFTDKEETNEYITVVRTDFVKFKKEEECEEDIRKMINNGGELSEVIKETYKRAKIIHVNNPLLDVEKEKKWIENVKERKISRTALLNYLEENCCEIYKPHSLEELNAKIGNYMKEKEKLEREIRKIKDNNQELKAEKERTIEKIKKNTRQIIIDILQEKEVKWTGITQVGIGVAGIAVAIVVPLACKIM